MKHVLALLLLAACTAKVQAAPAVSSAVQSAKQAELKALHSQLAQLKKDLANNESQKAEAADALKDAESSISEANRVLAGLSEARELTANELASLERDIVRARTGIRKSQDRLKVLIRTRYQAGQIEAWRLLLNQQDPNRVSRELTYYRYISKAQLELARTLERQLAELNRLADEIRQKNEALRRIAKEKQKLKAQLIEDQQEKSKVLSQLSKEIGQQRNQIQKLAADEKRMTTLIEKLNAIARQQAAERAKQQAKQKTAQEKIAKQEAAKATQVGGASKPKALPLINDALPDESQAGTAFAALKGKLRLPMRGELIGRFGTKRNEGGSTWKGVFIRAASGLSVKAVGNGKVVFADWMRGFGNLLILDHGGGYLSIYAANESLLKQVGDTVKVGDNIATSGNSGGMGDSGVYFELRQNGNPLDPMSWVGA